MIFGLSLSIGAISLVITNSQSSRVSDINKNILDFLFVFLFLITIWIIYTGDMSVLPVETRLVIFLNVVLLMLVAVIPYLFDQVEAPFNVSDVQNYPSVLFTIDYATMLFIMAVFAHVISVEEKQLVEQKIMARYWRYRNVFFFLTLVVLVPLAAPRDWTFLGTRVRFFLWLVPIIMFWSIRMTRPPL